MNNTFIVAGILWRPIKIPFRTRTVTRSFGDDGAHPTTVKTFNIIQVICLYKTITSIRIRFSADKPTDFALWTSNTLRIAVACGNGNTCFFRNLNQFFRFRQIREINPALCRLASCNACAPRVCSVALLVIRVSENKTSPTSAAVNNGDTNLFSASTSNPAGG